MNFLKWLSKFKLKTYKNKEDNLRLYIYSTPRKNGFYITFKKTTKEEFKKWWGGLFDKTKTKSK